MKFEWNQSKSDHCFSNRGFDFAYATNVFADPHRMIKLDDRYSYGEDRYQVTGRIEGRLFVVVFTTRGQTIRIISARKANQREVRDYETSVS